MRHEFHDRVSIEIATRVARELPRRREWLAPALSNLERWTAPNQASPSLIRCYDEWRSILTRPIPDICTTLTAPTDEGQRLRQNSPFAGALAPEEIWDIKRRLRHEQNAA